MNNEPGAESARLFGMLALGAAVITLVGSFGPWVRAWGLFEVSGGRSGYLTACLLIITVRTCPKGCGGNCIPSSTLLQ